MNTSNPEPGAASALVECLRAVDLISELMSQANDRLAAEQSRADSQKLDNPTLLAGLDQVAELKQELDVKLRRIERLAVTLADSVYRLDVPNDWRNCYGFRLQDLPREI